MKNLEPYCSRCSISIILNHDYFPKYHFVCGKQLFGMVSCIQAVYKGGLSFSKMIEEMEIF